MSVTFTLPKNINFDQVEPSPTSRSFVDARFAAVADLVDQAKAEFDASLFYRGATEKHTRRADSTARYVDVCVR